MSFVPAQTTRPNGGKSDENFRYDKNAKVIPDKEGATAG
jgi:hypothetical protein